MGMGFAPTSLRQVSPHASQNHFNHWLILLFTCIYVYVSSIACVPEGSPV